MDAMPPSPPPAEVRDVHQDAIDIVQRLIATERWLIEQQDAMPALPDTFTAETLAAFLRDTDAFWATTIEATGDTASRSRRKALEDTLRMAMLDLATLRGVDRTLEDDAIALVFAALGPHAVRPPHVELREVTIGDATHAGSLLIVDTRVGGPVVAFTATRGWDRYADLTAAHTALEKQARAMLATRVDLPGLTRGRVDVHATEACIGSRPLGEPALATLVDGVVAMQRDKVEQAWIEFELERALPGRAPRLADRLRDAIDLADLVDVEAVLGVREARLRIALENERLLTVPASLAADWRRSRGGYMDTLQFMAERQALAGIGPPTELRDYAIGQLEPVLKALGVTEDPRDITLTLDRSRDPAARLTSLTTLIYGPEPLHASLIDAAYSNVPAVGADRFTAHGKDDHLIEAFSDPYIRAVLNRLDIHTHYQALLLSELRDGPDAALRRRGFRESRMARMRHEAAEARVASLRGEYGQSHHLGLTAGGRARVDALLDALGEGRALPTLVRQVTFRDMPLRDVMQIEESPGAGASGATPAALVYYTPDAPDGAAFREFRDRDEADRLFFRHAAFRDYLLARLPAAADTMLRQGGVRLNANRSLAWILGQDTSVDDGEATIAPGLKDVAGDPFDALYDTALDHALRNVQSVTRSARDANREFLLDAWHRNPAHVLPAQTLVATITAPFRVAPAAWRAYDAIKAGGYGDGFVDATEGYVMALAAYSLGMSALHATTAPYAIHFRAIGGALVSRALARPIPGPHRRYLARGVTATGVPDLQGMYRVDGKLYAAIEGKLYEANYHPGTRTVRLGAASPAGVEATGPVIRLQGELWHADRHAGHRRAVGRRATHPVAASDFYSEYVNQLEQAFPDAIERQLVSDQMYREIRGLPTRRIVTDGQRAGFHQALTRAEQSIRASFDIGPSLPGRLRQVAEADLPERLWFYDEKPIAQSAFFGAARPGMTWGAIRSEAQERDVFGVRLSAVPPQAPMHTLVDGNGVRLLDRTRGFAIEVKVRDLLQSRSGGQDSLDLLSIVGTQGRHYVLRTPPGRPVMLEAGQFRLVPELPETPP
jgi:hypothetical protein